MLGRAARLRWTAAILLLAAAPALAENTDPANDGSQWAWSENAGWLNAEPSGNGGPGVQVGDTGLTGFLWSENAGWISLSCQNTASCVTQSYGVTNNGCGVMAGYAWAENAGWISFSCSNTGTCASASYGVAIDPATGNFSGKAWAENLGWISFASTGPNPFKVRTSWTAPSLAGTSMLTLAKGVGTVVVQWTPLAGAGAYQVVRGSLTSLRTSGGDFSAAVTVCEPGLTTNMTSYPLSATAEFYLVRGTGCGVKGTMNEPGGNQAGSRDAEIAASGHDCP
jgi:hypothetical protein